MALTFQEHWMFSGSTTVPNVLIQYYRHLQLSADECLLIFDFSGFLKLSSRKSAFFYFIANKCLRSSCFFRRICDLFI